MIRLTRARRRSRPPLLALGGAIFVTGGVLDVVHHTALAAGGLPLPADEMVAHGATLAGMLLIVVGLVLAAVGGRRSAG